MRTRSGFGSGRAGRLVAAATVALLLGACGGGDEGEEATPTTAGAATTQPAGSATVRVEYLDYAYSVSGPLTAGGVLQLRNAGKEFHMMGIGRFKAGKSLADVRDALSRMGPPGGGGEQGGGGAGTTTTSTGRTTTTTTRTGGTTTTRAGGQAGGEEEDPLDGILDELGLPGNIMGPGQSVELTVPNMSAGNYALLCFLPTEGEGTPHFNKGMIGELRVVAGTPPPPPTADATYKVAPGQAVQGPATLSAGRRTIRVERGPGGEQLEAALAKPNQGRTFRDIERVLDRAFEGETPPARNMAGQVPGQLVFYGFDLREVTTFYLTLDLTPGTYSLVAEDGDQQDGVPTTPPREIINIRVT